MQSTIKCLNNTNYYVLCNEDCLDTSRRLSTKSIDLIYSDPPFYTDRIFKKGKFYFADKWDDADDYVTWLKPRFQEFKRILKKTGSIYIHCDWHMSHYIKVLADKIFSRSNFITKIIDEIYFSALPITERTKGILFDLFVSNPSINNKLQFDRITLPVLIMNSIDDPATLIEGARKLANRIKTSKLLTFEKGGHLILGHEKEIRQNISEFISNHN